MLDKDEIRRWERLTDAMLKHAAADDPEAFAQVVAVLERATAKLPDVCEQMRWQTPFAGRGVQYPYSWADVGRALGVTRQAAQQRFGKR